MTKTSDQFQATGQKIAAAGGAITKIVYGLFALALLGFVIWLAVS